MRLGFIGTGKIASSVVTGICRSKITFTKILLSPRNKNVAKNNKVVYRLSKIVIFRFSLVQNSRRSRGIALRDRASIPDWWRCCEICDHFELTYFQFQSIQSQAILFQSHQFQCNQSPQILGTDN